MNRHYHLEIGLISGVIGLFSEYFGNIQVSYIILLLLMAFDTATGVALALKRRRFSYKGFKKIVRKLTTYSLAVLTVRLLEIGIATLLNTTLLSQVMVAFLIITEAVSILEKLAQLGVPITPAFTNFLLGNLKLPGMDKSVNQLSRDNEKYIADIDEIIAYQIPTIEDPCMKRLLEVKFDIWKDIAIQIENELRRDEAKSADLIYYKVLSVIEAGFDEMEARCKEENISSECVSKFNEWQKAKVDMWLPKVKTICLSEDKLVTKREQLIDSIVILLFQTIIDARKSNIKNHPEG